MVRFSILKITIIFICSLLMMCTWKLMGCVQDNEKTVIKYEKRLLLLFDLMFIINYKRMFTCKFFINIFFPKWETQFKDIKTQIKYDNYIT